MLRIFEPKYRKNLILSESQGKKLLLLLAAHYGCHLLFLPKPKAEAGGGPAS
ncbi:hypothetical protein [Streptomyces sp. NPDC000410]|uniref:hypothetical protein n=1 Tax=Streptomyces sp. NPDC000410 TaxID=3154254 RepID=UPI00333141EA